MQSSAATVDEYSASMPEDRRKEFESVRKLILSNLPEGYTEQMLYGMASYVIPHSLYPAGYHCDPSKPVTYIGLANQKNDLVIYLMAIYGNPELAAWFQEEWQKTGCKLKMGKSCIHFKRASDLATEVLAATIARVSVAQYLERYESAIPASKRKVAARGKAL